MEDDKSIIVVDEFKLVESNDKKETYRLSDLKRQYIISLDTPVEFAKKYNIDLFELLETIKTYNWDDERRANSSKILQGIDMNLASVIYEEIETQIRIQKYAKMQTDQILNWIENYLRENQDLFVRNEETKEIMTDHLGQPIPLKLPNTAAIANDKMQSLTLVTGLRKLLKETLGLSESEIKVKAAFLSANTINLDQFNLFKK